MFVQKSISGNVKWLGVPSFLQNDGPPWADNILCPSPRWVFGGTVENWALESQPGSRYGGVDIPWRGAVSACPDYFPQSP